MRLDRKPTASVDLIAVIAMALAMLAIVWARIEVIGTADLEDVLSGQVTSSTEAAALHAEALLRNRSVTGFTQ